MHRSYRWSLVAVIAWLGVGLHGQAPPPEPEQGPALVAPPMLELPLTPAPSVLSRMKEAPAKLEGKPPSLTKPGTGESPADLPLAPPGAADFNKAEAPLVTVEKIVPPSINAGKPLVAEIVIKNAGQGMAYRVRVEDELAPNAKLLHAEPAPKVQGDRLVWTIDSLAPGAERRFKITVQPEDGNEVATRASVTYSSVAGAKTKILHPRLAVKKIGPEKVTIGDSLTFRFEISNPGTGTATNVVVHDNLPDGFQHAQGPGIEADIGNLEPGASKTLDLTVKAVKAGKYVNEVLVSADDGLQAKDALTIQVGAPSLRVSKNGPTQRYVNTEAMFNVEVTNTGDATARKVQVIDALPAGIAFLEAGDGGVYDAASNSVQWTLDALRPGESRRVRLKVRLTEQGEQRNTAVARTEPKIEAKAEAIVNVVGVSALMLEVKDSVDPVEVGGETVYEIQVVNQGTAASTNMEVMAMIPEGMSFVRAKADVDFKVQGRQVIFAAVPTLHSKSEAVYRVAVRGETPGDHRFKIQLQSDQLRIPVSEEESTHVFKAD